jgi:hypothetical protein
VRRSGSVVDAAPCAGWHQRQSVITHSWLGVTRRANRGHTTEACTRSRACWRVALRRVRHCTPPAAHTNRSDCEARTCCRHCRLADSPGMWHACTHVARTWHAHTSQQQAQTVLVARHAVECSLQAAQPLHHGCDIRPGHLGPGRRLQRGLRRACQRCVHADTHRQHPSIHRTSTAWVTCRQPTHQAARPRDCCEKMLGQTRPGHPATRRRLHISAVLLHVSSTHTGAVPASSPAACLHVQAGTCVRHGW